MSDFALLWCKILNSSIWLKGTKEAKLLWITFLAMKNRDGQVFSSLIGLADRAKLTVEECREALAFLMEPDPDDSSGVNDGRRVKEIPGGWEVVNNDLYRFSTEARREFWRQMKAEQRAKKEQPKRTRRQKQSCKVQDREELKHVSQEDTEEFDRKPMPLERGLADVREYCENGTMMTQSEPVDF